MILKRFTRRLATALLFVCAIFFVQASAQTANNTRLLRYPDIHGNQVVFTYAGDLWTAARTGGQARRVASHPGEGTFAKFSPHGKWVGFTAQ